MAIPFSGIITPTSVIFTTLGGKMINVTSSHINFEQIKATIKQYQMLAASGGPSDAEDLLHFRHKLDSLADVSRAISKASKGVVEVRDGVVTFEGEPMHNAIADRVLQGLSEGFDMDPYLRFIENLMKNPSKRSVDELYGFIEKSAMGITDDGMIAAYKRVRRDYTDCHSGRFDNSVGKVLEMARNRVDDDSARTCSYGFHFCSFTYLAHFGSAASGDRIMIVKVNPADVVSIPKDYNDAKARCSRYEVIGEYEGSDREDILATRAVWSGDNDWQRELPKPRWDAGEEDIYSFVDNELDIDIEDGSTSIDDPDETDDEDVLLDLEDRVYAGQRITEALYTNRALGDFVSVVLTLDGTSTYTIFDESLLPNVASLIGESDGKTKFRLNIVP